MISQVWGLIVDAVLFPVDWFTAVLSALGGVPLYMGAIATVLIYRFILYPVVGHRGSDTVEKKRKRSDS